VTRYHHPLWIEDGRFRAGLDDVIIIPLVFVTPAATKSCVSFFDLFGRSTTPPSNAACLASAFAANVLAMARCNHKRALRPSAFQDETSKVRINPELVVAPAKD
jgi:hypothetical protein